MKVAFLSPALSRIAGGIFEIERELALALDALPDTHVSAYGVIDRETANDAASWRHIPLHLGALKGPHGFGYSPELRDLFRTTDADIVHLHALWMYTSILARRWGRSTGKPYVTTANGMLEPWARSNAALKKRAAAIFYERRALRDVGCLHVNTAAELQSARDFGLSGPFCIIPNGVTLSATAIGGGLDAASPVARAIKAGGGKILLFLGRLHPKKNLAATVDAFIALAPTRPDWHFVAAGWGDDAYRDALRESATAAGLADRVHFPGAVYAEEKAALLASADAYVLASHSEGFPMAVLEAFANGLPVAMTKMCNLQAGFDCGAAVEVGTTSPEIASGLAGLFDATAAERSAMGAMGRALVERNFTWDQVAVQMRAVYSWLIDGGPVPDTVVQ